MKKQNINDIKIGMIIGEDLYNSFDVMIIASGTIITKQVLNTIDKLDLFEIAILEKEEEGNKKFVIVEDKVQKTYESTVESFRKLFDGAKIGEQILAEEVSEILTPMLDEVKTNPQLAKKLWQIEACDEYTYDHSVTVSMASALLGKWMGFNDAAINEIATAGLLHDIGKCNIPDEILKKPDRLTEEEFKVMKTHSTLGYLLLKNNKTFTDNILQGVYQHHEKYDGKGYPNKLVGENIHLYGRLIAIADVYSAMTSNRIYRKKMSPFLVAKLILDYSFGYLDPTAVNVFLTNISNFYIGSIVKLNDNRIGEIILINKTNPYRPLVKIEDEYVDLAKNYDLEIDSLID